MNRLARRCGTGVLGYVSLCVTEITDDEGRLNLLFPVSSPSATNCRVN